MVVIVDWVIKAPSVKQIFWEQVTEPGLDFCVFELSYIALMSKTGLVLGVEGQHIIFPLIPLLYFQILKSVLVLHVLTVVFVLMESTLTHASALMAGQGLIVHQVGLMGNT